MKDSKGEEIRVIQEKFPELNEFPDAMNKNKDHSRTCNFEII